VAAAIIVIMIALWTGGMATLAMITGLVDHGDSFSIVHWEIAGLTGFALRRLPLGLGHRQATNAEVEQYFSLLRQARVARRDGLTAGSAAEHSAFEATANGYQAAAARLRASVETRFEQSVEEAATAAGLTERLPLYGDVRLVWPPVAAGFSIPPHILIISPRDHIELKETTLLRTNLSDVDAARIEREHQGKDVSALVDQIGGLGAYPSIDDQDDSPQGLMQTVAHEWTHEYLVFHPLGARYAQSGEMTLINETVANLVGHELGSSAFDRLGLPIESPSAAAPSTAPALDFNRTMHELRLEVDALLKNGQIDKAERRMNETQVRLAANGYNIRRINQAYFAFYGSYGDSPASSSPLGGSIESLRRLSPSLTAFVHRIQDIARPADLDRLLATSRRG